MGRQKESNHRCELDIATELRLSNRDREKDRQREKDIHAHVYEWKLITHCVHVKCCSACECLCVLVRVYWTNIYILLPQCISAHNRYTSTCMCNIMKQNELKWNETRTTFYWWAARNTRIYTLIRSLHVLRASTCLCMSAESMECIWDARNRLHCIA